MASIGVQAQDTRAQAEVTALMSGNAIAGKERDIDTIETHFPIARHQTDTTRRYVIAVSY